MEQAGSLAARGRRGDAAEVLLRALAAARAPRQDPDVVVHRPDAAAAAAANGPEGGQGKGNGEGAGAGVEAYVWQPPPEQPSTQPSTQPPPPPQRAPPPFADSAVARMGVAGGRGAVPETAAEARARAALVTVLRARLQALRELPEEQATAEGARTREARSKRVTTFPPACGRPICGSPVSSFCVPALLSVRFVIWLF